MFLREVGARLHAKVLFVDYGTRNHADSILDWADCMTNSATGTILFNDLGERVVSVELNGLITGVSASEEAASALETVIIVDLWY